MKLSTLLEAGMSRRDFLKKTGASSILPSLVGAGIAPEVAKNLVGPSAPRLFLHIAAVEPERYSANVRDEFSSVASAYNALRRVVDKDSEIVHGANNADSFVVGTYITPEKLAELFNKANDSYDGNWSDTGIYHTLDFDAGSVQVASDDFGNFKMLAGDVTDDGDLLESWWHSYGQYNTRPIDDSFFTQLKNRGIDPTEREDWIKEEILDEMEEFPEDYGDPQKYGIEEQPQHQEPEDIEAPEDYRLASPMHQPFESKLAKILGIL